MNSTTYYAAWTLVALGLIAWLSAAITRVKRRSDSRRDQALCLIGSLQRYSEWVVGQRLVALFQGEDAAAAAALDEACLLRRKWFPELASEMTELLAVHDRLLEFLAAQQALWLRDPSHWLASHHDKRYMALWRQHHDALRVLQGRLHNVASLRRRRRAPRCETSFALTPPGHHP